MRAQLARVLESPDFDATARTRKFLTYITDETIKGRADRIKAYSIAIEVLGRDASFDAHSDPIVRIEAGHLRRALDRYYLTAGVADPVVISVPKGSYVPKFETRRAAEVGAQAAKPVVWPRWLGLAAFAVCAIAALSWFGFTRLAADRLEAPAVPRLLVKPFDDLTGVANSQAIARGLTREIVGQIAKFKDIVAIEANAGFDGIAPGSPENPRYELTGDIDMTDDQFRLRARLINSVDRSVIWANSYDGGLQASKLIGVETEIARQVATTLAQTYGVIFQADASQQRSGPDDWQAYACTLSYYSYRAGLDAKTHPIVRKCLEDAVQRFPNYATAWALLSQTYVDEVRFRYPTDPNSSPASIDKALAAARRAVELDPENIRALQAEMFALYFNGDVEAALRIGDFAMGLNPNDTELAGEFGYRLALSGDWARGCAMIEDARQRNPGPLAYYESALAMCSYFRGNLGEAVMWITKTTGQQNPNYHLIAATIFADSGREAEARRERDWLEVNAPNLIANLRAELALRLVRPKDVDRVMASLKKVGITPPGEAALSSSQ